MISVLFFCITSIAGVPEEVPTCLSASELAKYQQASEYQEFTIRVTSAEVKGS